MIIDVLNYYLEGHQGDEYIYLPALMDTFNTLPFLTNLALWSFVLSRYLPKPTILKNAMRLHLLHIFSLLCMLYEHLCYSSSWLCQGSLKSNEPAPRWYESNHYRKVCHEFVDLHPAQHVYGYTKNARQHQLLSEQPGTEKVEFLSPSWKV